MADFLTNKQLLGVPGNSFSNFYGASEYCPLSGPISMSQMGTQAATNGDGSDAIIYPIGSSVVDGGYVVGNYNTGDSVLRVIWNGLSAAKAYKTANTTNGTITYANSQTATYPASNYAHLTAPTGTWGFIASTAILNGTTIRSAYTKASRFRGVAGAVPYMNGGQVWTSGTQSTATTAPYINITTGVTSTATKTSGLIYSFPMKIGGLQFWYE
jgi:hypothetical protein